MRLSIKLQSHSSLQQPCAEKMKATLLCAFLAPCFAGPASFLACFSAFLKSAKVLAPFVDLPTLAEPLRKALRVSKADEKPAITPARFATTVSELNKSLVSAAKPYAVLGQLVGLLIPRYSVRN